MENGLDIPEGWQRRSIREIGEVVTGRTPSTNQTEFYGGEYHLVSPADLNGKKYVVSAHRRLTRLGFEQCRALPRDAVLVGCIGNVGKIGMVPDDQTASNQQINAIICNPDYDPHFVYYRLYNDRDRLETAAVKTTVPILNKTNFERFAIDVPSLPEQQKIAAVLGLVQRAIEQQERLIALTTELKKALLHKLFTEGLRGEPPKQTEIGPVPESWEIKKLGSLVNLQTGKLNSNAATPNGQYPFFTCSQQTFRIDHYAFDAEAILLSGNNAQGIYSVKHYNGKFNAYQRTYVITVKEEATMPYPFLHQALSRNLERLRSLSIGTSTKYLTLGVLQNLPIPKPDHEEAKRISDQLKLIDTKVELVTRKKETLTKLFSTLLHRLMTAQIRVNDLNLDEILPQPVAEMSDGYL